MSYRKKFRIAGLGKRARFAETMQPVMAHHFARTEAHIVGYLKNPGSEALHDLRIALRRFRYILELYWTAMKPARFKKVYEMAVRLQNLLGERRDIDVMQAKLADICREAKAEMPAFIAESFSAQRRNLETQIAESLNEFLHHKQVRKLADR